MIEVLFALILITKAAALFFRRRGTAYDPPSAFLFLFLLDTTKTHRFEYTRVWWYIGKTKVQKKETG